MSEKITYWRFSLTIDEKNEVELNWSYLSTREPSKKKIKEKLLEEFHIKLFVGEQVLISQNIPKIIPSAHKEYEDIIVSAAVPFDYKTTHIVIYRNKTEVFKLPIPQEKPLIELLEKKINTEEKTELKWNYKTISPEYTWFRLFIELDNGKRYPISNIIRDNSFKLDPNKLPGCENGKLIAMISDGVWTAEDVSEKFNIAPKKPKLMVFKPKAGQKIQTFDFLHMNGRAWDYQTQSPITSEKLRWKLDGKAVGTGKVCVIAIKDDLNPGKHIVSLFAEDSKGNINSHDVEIEVTQTKHPKIVFKDDVKRKE